MLKPDGIVDAMYVATPTPGVFKLDNWWSVLRRTENGWRRNSRYVLLYMHADHLCGALLEIKWRE